MAQSAPYQSDGGGELSASAGVEAAAVLEAYVKALESSEREIRDAADLPYDKEMIKAALLEAMEAAEEDDEEDVLIAAWNGLAWFQPLNAEEAEAISAFDAAGDPEAAPEALETEETLAQSGGAYAAVLARIEAESAKLRAELAEAGIEP